MLCSLSAAELSLRSIRISAVLKSRRLLTRLSFRNAENAKLEQILDSDDRDEYIEQKAREKGYVKSDEIVFYDVAGSK